MTKPPGQNHGRTYDAVSAMNALDLALRSQELDAEATATMRRLLPLLDQVEKVCRDFDKLSAEQWARRSELVAILAEMATVVARETGLDRFTGVGERVDGARHEVIETRPLAGDAPDSHGCILAVTEPGWLYHGLVLRRAKVVAASRD